MRGIETMRGIELNDAELEEYQAGLQKEGGWRRPAASDVAGAGFVSGRTRAGGTPASGGVCGPAGCSTG